MAPRALRVQYCFVISFLAYARSSCPKSSSLSLGVGTALAVG